MYILEPKSLHKIFADQHFLASGSYYRMSFLETIIKTHYWLPLDSGKEER